MSDLPLTDELPMPAAARASARAQHVAQSGGGEAMRGPITVDGRLAVLISDITSRKSQVAATVKICSTMSTSSCRLRTLIGTGAW